mmetsp:Transcript_37232/g.91654  ORF Transcript_37232/g.91654 Transcript_37232/m.91654 type:complete len:528 (+) Transcript_37232:184-1767(+)
MSCTKCQMFAGTPENEGLCSSCFKTTHPEKVKEREALSEKRRLPADKWEERLRKAFDNADAAGVRAAFDEMAAALVSEADGDEDLCKRHKGRMEVILENVILPLGLSGEGKLGGLRALVDAKITDLVEPRKILKKIIGQRGAGELGLKQLDVLLSSEIISEELTSSDLAEVVYHRDALPWIDRLLQLSHINVTPKVMKYAKHLNSSTNGGPSQKGKAIVAHLEAAQKPRNKAAAEERKRQRALEAAEGGGDAEEDVGPSEPPPKRATRGSGGAPAPVSLDDVAPKRGKKAAAVGGAVAGGAEAGPPEACSKICSMVGNEAMFLMSAKKWSKEWPELWTCGLHDPVHPLDHAAHAGGAWRAGHKMCEDIEKQLASWKPEFDDTLWQAFFITQETLTANGLSEDDSLADSVCKVLGCDVEEGGIGSKMQTLALKDSRKTFFHQRFYFTYQVDVKALAKVKAATNKIKSATQKDSCVFMQFAHDATCTVEPIVYIAGRAKPQYCDGGILVVCYRDPNQDHYHHRSIKNTD